MNTKKHFCGDKKDWHGEEFKTLVTLGESTTAGGWSSSRERCWASRLAVLISDVQTSPVTLINSGIGANVISTKSTAYEMSGKPAASERLEKHVIRHKPDLLVISYGLNDMRGGTPLGLFVSEMKKIIARVRKKINPLIVLPGPYFFTDFSRGGEDWSYGSPELLHEFNDAICKTAREKDCLFVDLLSAYGCAVWMVHHDGVHANDLGHLVVANKIFEVLAQNCSGLSRNTKNKEKLIPPWRDESCLKEDYGYPGNKPGIPFEKQPKS